MLIGTLSGTNWKLQTLVFEEVEGEEGTKNLVRREYYNIEPTGGNPTQMTLARGEWSLHCAKPAPMSMPANLRKGRGGVSNEILENIKDTSSHLVLNYPQWIVEEEGEGE